MVIRIAVLDRDTCIEKKCGYICMKVCPPNKMGEECIYIEEGGIYPVISEELCIGCGLCVKKCPVSCIEIINLSQELDEPVFQYGINAFRLYGLPLPKEGAVAFVGKNGIGKTTAIKLLSGTLKPNFAIFDGLDDETLFSKMKPEWRRYFQEMPVISVKPQHIERIRSAFQGTVKDLIIKMDCSEDVVNKLELSKILDRKIVQLSGGELQKVALAIAIGRDADLYYIDEVTNYLDIGERLKASLHIKELAEKRKVMMAEHDLALLDYVCDYVYLFYGEESTYGIVSGVKNIRAGINEYLSGYLKEENVRFRDHELSFKSFSEVEKGSKVLYSYEDISVDLGSFNLTAEGGEIRESEILGIVGKNALGKTLFLKSLAEQFGLKVAHKKQYIEPTEDLVIDYLKFSGPLFEECKRKFKLMPLMEKKLTELSGGQLQRVEITKTLCQDADVYLLDEPSAFLDIEQRFELSDILNRAVKEKCAFVVDHDIVLIDSIASKVIVFEGESSVYGKATKPMNKKDGMNLFLKSINVTMRRDKESKRPRINKPGSRLDKEQRASGNYFETI